MGFLTSLAALKYLFSGSSSTTVPSAVPSYVRGTDEFGAWASSTRLGIISVRSATGCWRSWLTLGGLYG